MSKWPPPPTPEEIRRIAEILRKRGSAWANTLGNEGVASTLSDEDVEGITDLLVKEMFDEGMDADHEHNAYGEEIDDLIGVLQRMRPNYYPQGISSEGRSSTKGE